MKTTRPLLLSFFFILTLFLLISPAAAKVCQQSTDVIDYDGPYSVVFEDSKKDLECAYPTDASPLDMDVIYNGRLTSQLVDLKATLHGDENLLKSDGTGHLNMNLKDLSTFGIGGDLLYENPNEAPLLKYGKTIEAYKNYDITSLYRKAYADGVTTFADFEAWACDHELCICGLSGCHVNPSIYSNSSQLLPLDEQLLELYNLATEILNCSDSAYADEHKCSTFYPLPGGNSKSIAAIVKQQLDPNNLMESWRSMTDQLKFQAFSLHLTQSSPTFVLIVPQATECPTIFCLIAKIFDITPDNPGFIKAIIPETQNLKYGVNAENNRFTPLKDQTSLSAKPIPTATAPLLEELLKAAKQRDPNCGQAAPKLFENLGASSTPVKNQTSFTFNFGLAKDHPNQDIKKMYCVYVFSPPDLVDADYQLAEDNNALLRKLFPLKNELGQIYTGWDKDKDAPQQLDAGGTGQTVDNVICLNYKTNPITGTEDCIEEEHNYVEYSGAPDYTNQPAGKITDRNKIVSFQIALPLKEGILANQCLVDYLDAGAQSKGFDFAGAINASNYPQSSCPDLIETIPAPNSLQSNKDICGIANEYGIPCCQLEGILATETGYGSPDFQTGTDSCGQFNCCTGIGCGPAQISCGQIAAFSGGESIDVCDPAGAATLLARAMKLKLCQADGVCQTYDWSQEKDKAMGYEISDGDYTAAAYFHGLQNGCTLSGCTQYRWGAGNGYCDSIEAFCTSGQALPEVQDQNFCEDCNRELINSGVAPMQCTP